MLLLLYNALYTNNKELILMESNEIISQLTILLKPINDSINEMKQDIRELKEDVKVLKEDVKVLKEDVCVLKNKVGVLEKEMDTMKKRMDIIQMTQEKEILPSLKLIEKCYIDTYDRYRASVDDYMNMKTDISVLKMIVAEHA